MIKHIVMWKLKNSKRDAPALKRMLEGLRKKVPHVRKIEAGVNFNPSDNAADVVLYSEFDDLSALAEYQGHPDHVKVAEFVKKAARERRVVDYED